MPVGEDTIYYNKDRSVVLNEEVLEDEVLTDLNVKREELKSATAAEVGNIFTLRYKFSEPLDLVFNDKDGVRKTVFMGCYGIGVSRVMGVIVEKYSDEKGLVWPTEIAPYQYYLIGIGDKASAVVDKLHHSNPDQIIIDDRDLRPGQKFADAELMGIPYRVVISDKTLEHDSVEITDRKTSETKIMAVADFSQLIQENQ